jgi:hypothetical protein
VNLLILNKIVVMEKDNLLLFEILENCYPEDKIFSKDLEIISNNKIIITYCFPSYKRAKRNISYASVNQIIPAILEGLFVASGNYVKSGSDRLINFNYEIFPEKMWDAIFREFDKLTFLKKIPKEGPVEIIFEVLR